MAARLASGIWAAELPRCSGDVGGDDVGGMPVQAGPVVGPVLSQALANRPQGVMHGGAAGAILRLRVESGVIARRGQAVLGGQHSAKRRNMPWR